MPDITSNLVAHFNLDETSGTTAADSSGNGYHGTYPRDAANTTVAGRVGTAYDPNGSSDYIATTIPTSLLPSAGTIAFWAKDLSTASQILVSKGLNDQVIVLVDTSQLKLRLGTFGVNDLGWTISGSTGWHHYALTWTGTTGQIFRDGVLVATKSTLNALPAANSATWRIGQSDAVTAGFYGKDPVDDVRIYSRALAAEDVAALYAAGFGVAGRAVVRDIVRDCVRDCVRDLAG